MSSTTPWKFTNGPSMTRTLSPRWNTDFGLGFSAPASLCRRMSSTCSCVHAAEEQRHHHGHGDHHDRGVDELLAARPRDPAELRQDLPDELLCAPEKLHCSLTRRTVAGVEGFEPPSPGFGVRCSSR